MDYGYEGEVYFPVMLNVAKSLKPGPVTLHAKVNWLVCREVCIPGKAELEVKRRVATEEGISEENADYGLFLRQLKANSYPQQLPANAKAVFQPRTRAFGSPSKPASESFPPHFSPQIRTFSTILPRKS